MGSLSEVGHAAWRGAAEVLQQRLGCGGPGEPALLACFCAAWCYVCADWRPVFETQASAHPELRFVWVDIEDEADWCDALDIENFPTLLLMREGAVVHAGPVLARAATLEALLARVG